MAARIFNARRGRPHLRLSRPLQEQLLEAIASGEHTNHSLVARDLAGDAPQKTGKRSFDAPESSLLPAKRARTAQSAAQQPIVGYEKPQTGGKGWLCSPTSTGLGLAMEPTQTALRHPKPQLSKHSYASFLQEFVDLEHPSSCAVSEWLESVGLDRDQNCRSDSYLCYSVLDPDPDPISRAFTSSAPVMPCTRDATRFTEPPTPKSLSGSTAPSDMTGETGNWCRSSGKNLVESQTYRHFNLKSNNIFMRIQDEKLPDAIASLVRDLAKDRNSPELSADRVRRDTRLRALEDECVSESAVESYFRKNLFTDPTDSVLELSTKQPMSKHTVPDTPGSNFRLSNPVPDVLYGYTLPGICDGREPQLGLMINETIVNSGLSGLLTLPFLLVEFKSEDGKLWEATNQCMGGSASCVNVAQRLNTQLKDLKSDKLINTAAFSIAMNGTEARLYVTWKHDQQKYYIQKLAPFLVQVPEQYITLRKYVRNILDWGRTRRLDEIQQALGSIIELRTGMVSMKAKSRQPPFDGSETSGSKKQKLSSSDKQSSASNSSQAGCEDTNADDCTTHKDTTVEPAVPKHLSGSGQEVQEQALVSVDAATEPPANR